MKRIRLADLPFYGAAAGVGVSVVFIATTVGALPASSTPWLWVLHGTGFVVGASVGWIVLPLLRTLIARVKARTSSFKLAIATLALVTFAATVAFYFLWTDYVAAAVLAGIFGLMGGVGYRPKDWQLGDAIFAGALFGYVFAACIALYRMLYQT